MLFLIPLRGCILLQTASLHSQDGGNYPKIDFEHPQTKNPA